MSTKYFNIKVQADLHRPTLISGDISILDLNKGTIDVKANRNLDSKSCAIVRQKYSGPGDESPLQ